MITSVKKQELKCGNLDKLGKGDPPTSSFLTLELKNKYEKTNFLCILANTLRRVSYEYVPSYAFYSQCIDIRKNTSVFNNDYMKLRLSQLPLINIKCDVSYLLPEYIELSKYTDSKRLKHEMDDQDIGMYINITNTTDDVMNVTTDSAEFYINGKKRNNYKETTGPILLIQLRPNETFECEMRAVLGIGDNGIIWSPVSNLFYDYNKDKDEMTMTIKSNGQFDEYEILIKICNNVSYKIGEIKYYLKEYVPTEEKLYDESGKEYNKIELILPNNNYTLCNMINWFLQSHDDVLFSGVTKQDYSEKKILFKIGGKNPYNSFQRALEDTQKFFLSFSKEVYNKGQKYIRKELMEK